MPKANRCRLRTCQRPRKAGSRRLPIPGVDYVRAKGLGRQVLGPGHRTVQFVSLRQTRPNTVVSVRIRVCGDTGRREAELRRLAFILRVFASGHSHAAPLWGNDVVDANEQCERVVGTPDIPISRASPYLASFDLLLVLDPCSYRKPCSHSFRLTIYTNKKTIENCILSPKQFLLSRSICLPYLLWRPILCYIVLELYIIVH